MEAFDKLLLDFRQNGVPQISDPVYMDETQVKGNQSAITPAASEITTTKSAQSPLDQNN